ncbi:hypothetical protein BDP27DRAFT_1429619 [Rhodocollybia butyracea]|uniref:Uncharacterized protein n=1 Tax=Rhodocollybia butyracea TaxID=206335 RepID=A0A9P5TZZ6_9AGAR|nr:hypothetical protein BDP27DRAFT_1429619 [Rhodocollybia butyracea]
MKANVKGNNHLASGEYAIVNVVYLNCPTVAKPNDANTSLVASPYRDRKWKVTQLPNRTYTLANHDNGRFAAAHDLRQDAMLGCSDTEFQFRITPVPRQNKQFLISTTGHPRFYWGFGSDSQTAIVELDDNPENRNNWWTFESESPSVASDIIPGLSSSNAQELPQSEKEMNTEHLPEAVNDSHLVSARAFILMEDICRILMHRSYLSHVQKHHPSQTEEMNTDNSGPDVPPIRTEEEVNPEYLPQSRPDVPPIQVNPEHLRRTVPLRQPESQEELEGEESWQRSSIASISDLGSPQPRPEVPPIQMEMNEVKLRELRGLPDIRGEIGTARYSSNSNARESPQSRPAGPQMGTKEAVPSWGDLEQELEGEGWRQSDMASRGFFWRDACSDWPLGGQEFQSVGVINYWGTSASEHSGGISPGNTVFDNLPDRFADIHINASNLANYHAQESPQPRPEVSPIRMRMNEMKMQHLRQIAPGRWQEELQHESGREDWPQSDMASAGFFGDFGDMLGPNSRRMQDRSPGLMESPFTGKRSLVSIPQP